MALKTTLATLLHETSGKFDPSWKETPDLPGEIWDEPEELYCSYCHEKINVLDEPVPLRYDTMDEPLHDICYEKLIAKYS